MWLFFLRSKSYFLFCFGGIFIFIYIFSFSFPHSNVCMCVLLQEGKMIAFTSADYAHLAQEMGVTPLDVQYKLRSPETIGQLYPT